MTHNQGFLQQQSQKQGCISVGELVFIRFSQLHVNGNNESSWIKGDLQTHLLFLIVLYLQNCSSVLDLDGAFLSLSVRAEEEGGEGGGGEGGHGTSLRRLPDASQEGDSQRLRRRRGGGRGEHPGHRPQVPARAAAGHVQEVGASGPKEAEVQGPAAGGSGRLLVNRKVWGKSGKRVLAKLLEATHCLSRNLLISSFLLYGACVFFPFLFATVAVQPFNCHLAHFLQ